MSVNLNPKDYEENSFENGIEEENEVSGNLNNQRTDYTDLDESRGDGDENSGRGATTDQSIGKKNELKTLGILVFSLLAVLLIVMGVLNMLKSKPQKQQAVATQQNTEQEIANTKPHDFSEDELPVPEIANDAASGIVIDENRQPEIVVTQSSEPKINPILERRLGGSVLVNDGGNVGQSEQVNTTQVSHSGGVPQGFGEESNANERQLNFTGTTFSARVAEKRGDKTLLLTRGTTIPCVLVTKIVTDHAGLTKCQVTKNVWSANGKTVLIERSSVFLGEQTAAMLQGQARVAVRWTQLETPQGVLVQIDSPSVGKLGAAGNAAWVNHHFWKRFGGSIMISLIGDFSNGLSKRLSKRQSEITFEETADNANEMAAEALRNSINIPPTGTINQGALLNIMVARDVDFRSVYERVDLSDLEF